MNQPSARDEALKLIRQTAWLVYAAAGMQILFVALYAFLIGLSRAGRVANGALLGALAFLLHRFKSRVAAACLLLYFIVSFVRVSVREIGAPSVKVLVLGVEDSIVLSLVFALLCAKALKATSDLRKAS